MITDGLGIRPRFEEAIRKTSEGAASAELESYKEAIILRLDGNIGVTLRCMLDEFYESSRGDYDGFRASHDVFMKALNMLLLSGRIVVKNITVPRGTDAVDLGMGLPEKSE